MTVLAIVPTYQPRLKPLWRERSSSEIRRSDPVRHVVSVVTQSDAGALDVSPDTSETVGRGDLPRVAVVAAVDLQVNALIR